MAELCFAPPPPPRPFTAVAGGGGAPRLPPLPPATQGAPADPHNPSAHLAKPPTKLAYPSASYAGGRALPLSLPPAAGALACARTTTTQTSIMPHNPLPPSPNAHALKPSLPAAQPAAGGSPSMLRERQQTSPSILQTSPMLGAAARPRMSSQKEWPTPKLKQATTFRWRRGEKTSVEKLQKVLAAMSVEEHAHINSAASRLQRRWRACQQKVMLQEYMRNVYSQPDLEKAKQHAVSFLPKDRHGHLFPLTAPLRAFHPLGCGVALYIHLLHWWSGFTLLGSLLMLPSMTINMMGYALNTTDVFTGLQTIHTLGNADELTLAHGATEIMLVAIMVWFMFWQSARTKHWSARITHHDLSAANYTVMVGRMPTTVLETRKVRDWFARYGDVVHVGLSLNYRDVIVCAEEKRHLRQKLHASQVEWYLAKANSLPKQKVLRATRACARARHRLYVAEDSLNRLSQIPYSCTGYAFVTFDTVDAMQDCIADCRENLRYVERSGPITARMAPEPDDLLWENLQYSSLERWARSALASCIALALVAGSTSIILFSALVQQNATAGGFDSILLTLAGIGMLVCGYVVIFATVPLMAFKIERYQTSSSRERAIHLKLFCFQALVTILPAVWFCDVNLHPFSIYLGQNFYTAGAKIIIGGIVGDAFVINLLVDLGRPQDRIARWQARRARTQRAMNSLWKCNGDLYIAFRQQLVSKWIVLGLMFSSVVPALLPLIFVFLFIANWVDRFNLLRHLAPPPPQDDSIMRQLVQILLPIGVLLHMAVACTAYAMKEGRIGPATTCTIVNAAIFTPLTLYYLYREHRSRRGMDSICRLGPQLGALVEYYLDIPATSRRRRGLEAMPSNVHNETFRESNDFPCYIPPLSSVLLDALGTDRTLAVTKYKPTRLSMAANAAKSGRASDDAASGDADVAPSRVRPARGTRISPAPVEVPTSDSSDARAVLVTTSERAPDEDLTLDDRIALTRSTGPIRRGPTIAQTPSPPRNVRSMSAMFQPRTDTPTISRSHSGGGWSSFNYADPDDNESSRHVQGREPSFEPLRTAPL